MKRCPNGSRRVGKKCRKSPKKSPKPRKSRSNFTALQRSRLNMIRPGSGSRSRKGSSGVLREVISEINRSRKRAVPVGISRAQANRLNMIRPGSGNPSLVPLLAPAPSAPVAEPFPFASNSIFNSSGQIGTFDSMGTYTPPVYSPAP